MFITVMGIKRKPISLLVPVATTSEKFQVRWPFHIHQKITGLLFWSEKLGYCCHLPFST